MFYNGHQYYKGWPIISEERLIKERRYDVAVSKATWVTVLRIVSYLVTAILGALGAGAAGM